MKRILSFIFLFTVATAPALHAKPSLSELAKKAETIYLLPLSPEPLTLTFDAGISGTIRPVSFEEELLSEKEIASFNASLLKSLNEIFDGKVVLAPKKFLKTKKRFGSSWQYWDLKAIDADLYVHAHFEDGSHKRTAGFKLSKIDTEQKAAYIPISIPQTKIILYHKPKAGKKGKKRAAAYTSLLGRHMAEMSRTQNAAQLMQPRVDALLAGETIKERFDSEFFPWMMDPFAQDPAELEKLFRAHAKKLKERAGKRFPELIDSFIKNVQKKLKK